MNRRSFISGLLATTAVAPAIVLKPNHDIAAMAKSEVWDRLVSSTMEAYERCLRDATNPTPLHWFLMRADSDGVKFEMVWPYVFDPPVV